MRAVTLGAGVAALLLVGILGPYGSMARAQAQSVDTESSLAEVKKGLCETNGTFAIAIHGGAVFSRNDQARKVAFLQQALTADENE